MEFSAFGFQLKISKKRNETQLKLDGLKRINNDTVSYIRSLSSKELKDRSDSVSFDDLKNKKAVRKTLDDSGIVIIKNFIPEDTIKKISSIVAELSSSIEDFLASDKRSIETEKILFQISNEKLSGYKELANHVKTVASVRQGQDKGMVDVFNVDYAFKELRSELRTTYEDSSILSIISNVDEKPQFTNLNFYFNSGVLSTRGFHADSFNKQLKAFIYLTDCFSLDDGPYTYVKESHKDSSYRAANKAISESLPNKTECPLIDHRKIIPVVGKAGSLVISDQSGFHRGFPQSEGHNRVVSVMNVTSQ